LTSRLIVARSKSLSSIIEQYVKMLFSSSSFLSKVTLDPPIIRCDSLGIAQFIKHAKNTKNLLNPQLSMMFIYIQGNEFCQIIWESDDFLNYTLQNVIKINGTYYLKEFQSEEVEIDYDPMNKGLIINIVDFDQILTGFMSYSSTHHTNIRIPFLNSSNNVYSILSDYSFKSQKSFGGIGFSLDNLYLSIKNIAIFARCKYVILDDKNNVLIESNVGSSLRGFDSFGNPMYPTLNSTGNPLWNAVNDCFFNVSSSTSSNFSYNDNLYFMVWVPVRIGKALLFKVLMVCNADLYVETAFQDVTYVLVSYLVLVCCVVFVGSLINVKNIKRVKDKIKKKSETISNVPSQYHHGNGTISRVINKLRNLEITYPQELYLNKALDSVIVHLSQPRYQYFVTKANINCPFCQHLTYYDPGIGYDISNGYSSWSSITSCYRIETKKLLSPNFLYDFFAMSPELSFYRLIITILHNEKLLFPNLDPDEIVMFFIKYITNFCTNVTETCQIVQTAFFLHKIAFHQIIYKKFEIFIILLTSSLCYTDISKLEADVNIRRGDDEAILRYEREKKSMIDPFSITERIISLIVEHVQQSFVGLEQKDSFSVPFLSEFKSILRKTSDYNILDTIGEAGLRIESPDFSVTDGSYDRMMLICSIIIISKFSPYLSSTEIMLKTITPITNKFLSPEEILDPMNIAHLHKNHILNIVIPVVETFTNVIEINHFMNNLKNNLNYWNKQLI